MPVILDSAEDMLAWLETPASGSEDNWSHALARLLKPFDGELDIYIVPKEVGKVGNQSADFLKPIAERKGNISSFFAKQQQKADSSPFKEAGSSDAKTAQSGGTAQGAPASAGKKAKGKAKLEERDDHEGQARDFGLPLNPDDGDKVKPASQAKAEGKRPIAGTTPTSAKGGRKSGKGASRPIVIDDKPTSGKAAEPIVLDDDDDDGDDREGAGCASSKASSGASLKRDRKSYNNEGYEDEYGPRKSKRTEASGQPKAFEGHDSTSNGEADAEGNAKLTNFFEIKTADEG
jgi:hypothetical protein